MGTIILIVIVIAILSAIKVPTDNPPPPASGTLSEARKRQLRKAARRAENRNRGGLPWFNANRRRRKLRNNYRF